MGDREYQEEIMKGFKILNDQKNVIFLGQNIISKGCPMYNALIKCDRNKMIELPVIEDTQLGMSIGLCLEGNIVVSVYPRIDFMICAMNQLVNHLDKVKEMSRGEFKPGVIVITQLGNTKPIDPGVQHKGRYTNGIKKLVKNIDVIKVNNSNDFLRALNNAKQGIPSLLVIKPSGPWKA